MTIDWWNPFGINFIGAQPIQCLPTLALLALLASYFGGGNELKTSAY